MDYVLRVEHLSQCKKNKTVQVKAFQGSEMITSRLMQIGVHIGKKVQVLGQAPFSGPLLIKVDNMVFALRTEEAHCILVSELG